MKEKYSPLDSTRVNWICSSNPFLRAKQMKHSDKSSSWTHVN